MHNTGWPVALVMSAFAYALDARDPVSFIWLASAARFVYGMDRFLDGKTSDSDTPEAITLALFGSFLALHSAGIEHLALPETACVQLYPAFKRRFAILKPIYVGLGWGGAVCAVPSLIEKREIDVRALVGTACAAAAVSNHADIADVIDDTKNGIETVPARFGRKRALFYSGALATTSVALLSTTRRNRRVANGSNSQARRNSLRGCSLSLLR